ncbi:salicylate carboxymethyltransferase-like [Papaver somniferum]|uniref:salicylate carboxymethyltransferase-like n=1 Tax=Papaver somniferum TaxID=3469 RepID=UPI000E6FE75F|nr:salicylate carboxymethyltransferase-like [Papaver somniferum]
MDQVTQHLHMNAGIAETSYASNSSAQKNSIYKTKAVVEEVILDVLSKFHGSAISTTAKLKSICIADLGCSSGPNALLDTIHNKYRKSDSIMPEILVFLNDLPGNDFNTLFKNLESFQDELRETNGDGFGPCFVTGTPGTFYGRLFPRGSLHFVHSSYSLHCLYKVPQGIEQSNKGNLYISKSSPPSVVEAYLEQFNTDFMVFLKCRSVELVDGGRMVLTLSGRRNSDPTSKECCSVWDLLVTAFKDMITKGMVEEEKLDSFNFPIYFPSPEEVQAVIQSEGSFMVDQLHAYNVNWDGSDSREDRSSVTEKYRSSYDTAKCIRAVSESLLVSHFGEEIIDELFCRYRENVASYATKEKTEYTNLVISMTKGGKVVPES